jgi:hypothetical protein
MHRVVERPYPADYEHPSGVRARIDFVWGEPDSSIPVAISIWLNTGASFLKLGEESGTWESFGEARRRGIELAQRWIQCGA